VKAPPPVKSKIAKSKTLAIDDTGEINPHAPAGNPHAPAENLTSTTCHGILDKLHLAASGCRLPLANEKNSLAIFAVNPENVINDGEDVWEILNPMVHQAFGYGANVEDAPVEFLKALAVSGKFGIDGFYHFMKYFVQHRGLSESLLESKVDLLIRAVDMFRSMRYVLNFSSCELD
jgi:hypothetical protein